MNRRAFIQCSAATLAATALGEGYETLMERLNVVVVPFKSPLGLQTPVRLVVAGDFHFDPLYEAEYVEKVVTIMNGLKADFICFTGDYVTQTSDRVKELAAILGRCTSRYGSYAVLGNHDITTYPDVIISALESQGIRVLMNESIPIPGQEKWYLSGIDSAIGNPDLSFFFDTPKGSNHVLLAHEPDRFFYLNHPSLRLQISGHTHGGQVRIPVYGPPILPTMGKLFDQGFFGSTTQGLYVNRGVGTVAPHVRFNCAPEITCIELS